MSNQVEDKVFYLYLTKQYKESNAPMPDMLEDSPSLITFNALGFHEEEVFSGGLLVAVNHYENYDEETETYSGLVIREVHHYDFNDQKICVKQTNSIEYYNVSGQVIQTRLMSTKFFRRPGKKIKMAVKARKEKVNDAKAIVYGALGRQRASVLLAEVSAVPVEVDGKIKTVDYMNLYIHAGTDDLYQIMANSTHPDWQVQVTGKDLRTVVTTTLKQETVNVK